MALIVQKFGGSLLSSLKKIRQVAKLIAQNKQAGNQIVVVVSAMGDETDELIELASKLSPQPPKRELDMLLTAGERKSLALLAIALDRLGYEAVSLTGSQVGILTDDNHTDARIIRIKGFRLKEALGLGKIPIVAGFQGMSQSREITTLGRGGSDITAVALAAWLKANVVELYKDVDGIFTEDPKEFPAVKHIAKISYDEMSELTRAGSQVLQPRACALAAKYNLNLNIKSMTGKGTIVTDNKILEKPVVRAITHSKNLCRFSLIKVPQQKSTAVPIAQAVSKLAQAKIPFVFFAHGVPVQNHFDLSFIIPKSAYSEAERVLSKIKTKLDAKELFIQKNLGSVSLIGAGIGSNPQTIAILFKTLQQLGIHVDAFSTAESRITCYFHQKDLKRAIEHLLDRFRLNDLNLLSSSKSSRK
ncbi:MAG: aspartate kinase [candidate division WOR-3 bacterium]